MVSVQEASDIVLSNLYVPSAEVVPLTMAVGRVLAEKIMADRDFPPFDRVAMDGIAISFETWGSGRKEFLIEDVQAAGEPVKKLRDLQNCLEVMTGAVLPEGTDTVIRYEDIEVKENKAVVMLESTERFRNVHRRGQDARHKAILLEPGITLSPAEIALLASVGESEVRVYSMPRTAIISSGDELIDITGTPAPHQIRRSNTYALEAAMAEMKWNGAQFHLPDRKDVLQKYLKQISAVHDVLILSGGVSKGKFDFIPEVLEEIGIKKIFHEVSQRPGKPFWFGRSDEGKTVFALPGNPVSTYMCFYRYIKPWLLRSLRKVPSPVYAALASDFSFAPELTYFLQVRAEIENGKLIAYPDAGGGSGDFANLKNVNGFLELPANRNRFEAGELFPYIPFRNIV
jgi:molybdopterin molybdotransferase